MVSANIPDQHNSVTSGDRSHLVRSVFRIQLSGFSFTVNPCRWEETFNETQFRWESKRFLRNENSNYFGKHVQHGRNVNAMTPIANQSAAKIKPNPKNLRKS